MDCSDVQCSANAQCIVVSGAIDAVCKVVLLGGKTVSHPDSRILSHHQWTAAGPVIGIAVGAHAPDEPMQPAAID